MNPLGSGCIATSGATTARYLSRAWMHPRRRRLDQRPASPAYCHARPSASQLASSPALVPATRSQHPYLPPVLTPSPPLPPSAARIKKTTFRKPITSAKASGPTRKTVTKFKIRCSRYLYTLVLEDADKAEKLKQSLPPGESRGLVRRQNAALTPLPPAPQA